MRVEERKGEYKHVKAPLKDQGYRTVWSVVDDLIPSDNLQYYLVLLIALLFRVSMSANPYSGENTPPNFGDFECHRVWMEVTYNLPASQWYNDTPYSNSSYWPIDYPPLCAYTHYGMA